ncbi:MAG: ShlB/FhaC/HecB family hemolysin secretion/activation protein [Helicobacteraceae bacterium]|nr:ShlB/FhaC/HecB family hemolysin secretion/activation protein [Helicobacteraceae bacterium]
MFKTIVLAILLINISFAANSNAERQLERQQDRTLDLLEKRQERNMIDRELNYYNKDRRIRKDKIDKDKQKEILEKKYLFTAIRFTNEVPDGLYEILSKYINIKLNINDIYELVKESTNYFVENGYTTTLVTVKRILKDRHILILEAKYGYVNNIYLNGEDSIRLSLGFPQDSYDKLNIFDLDQGIENLNNSSYMYNMQIKPSEKTGYSDIYIDEEFYSYGLTFDLDNSASKDKGMYRGSIGYTHSNLLNLNDSINLTYLKRFFNEVTDDKEDIYMLNYSIPIRYLKISYSLQYSYSSSMIYGITTTQNKSISMKHKLNLKYILHRSQTDKVSIYLNAELKDNTNKLGSIKVESSSGRYTSIKAGIDYSTKIANGSFFIMAEYQGGIPFLGGKRNSKDSVYDINYNKFYFNMSYLKYVYTNETLGLIFKTNFAGSYSKNTLLYADKFFVGDEYTIRGFKESSAAWDYGAYINNTLSLKFMQPHRLLNIEPFIGLDIGHGRDYGLPRNDTLVGIAAGFKYYIENFEISLTISKDLYKGYGMPNENLPIYFKISASV